MDGPTDVPELAVVFRRFRKPEQFHDECMYQKKTVYVHFSLHVIAYAYRIRETHVYRALLHAGTSCLRGAKEYLVTQESYAGPIRNQVAGILYQDVHIKRPLAA